MALTDKQIEDFKSQLQEMKEEVYQRNQNREENVDSEQLKGNDNHMANAGTAEYEHAREMALNQNDEQLINEIDEALQRIEEGTYGVCIDTGEEISIERLEAVPYAKRTIEAQKAYDEKKNPGDERLNTKHEDTSEMISQIENEHK
ncbi:TraR/DksA family transcriptional regulator [Pseudalkalibacillus sp. R45]|uniref:TraR/DksA family transcriptional regulator n=1 Tax=Pseudalkalibacillus sp. R45 TaxID=3457433 RepID=UPI003FCC4A30